MGVPSYVNWGGGGVEVEFALVVWDKEYPSAGIDGTEDTDRHLLHPIESLS